MSGMHVICLMYVCSNDMMYDLQCMVFPHETNTDTVIVGGGAHLFVVDLTTRRLLKEVSASLKLCSCVVVAVVASAVIIAFFCSLFTCYLRWLLGMVL